MSKPRVRSAPELLLVLPQLVGVVVNSVVGAFIVLVTVVNLVLV